MSYPGLVQPLVIDDETDVQETYDLIFKPIEKSGVVAPTCYAYCYQDALRYIQAEKMLHLVILDLRLPELPHLPAPEGIDLGLGLLSQCARRDAYPIPALLVISGQLHKAQQHALHKAVQEGFAYGRVVVKANLDALQDEVLKAVDAARQYCSLGIHLRDSGRATYPTISPREDDLLRRAATQQSSIGLDLEWWSANPYGRASEGAEKAWTKILTGCFLFSGDASSRRNFFKFIPGIGAEHSIEGARRMQSKLLHIKMSGAVIGEARALMITERVGTGERRPVSLGEFLSMPKASDPGVVAGIAQQISNQIQSLGETGPRMKPLRQLLWPNHDLSRTRSQWELYARRLEITAGPLQDPVQLLAELMSSEQRIRIQYQSTVHGDLHLENVAVDVTNDATEAYIIDCAGLSGHVAARDLVHLEVSALLHQQVPESAGLVRFCSSFYEAFLPQEPGPEGPIVQVNTWNFIRQLRLRVNEPLDERVYALLVLDYALIQLGGLEFGLSYNKVRDPGEVALLATLAARWYKTLTSGESANP